MSSRARQGTFSLRQERGVACVAAINADEFSAKAQALREYFDRTETGDLLVLTSKGQWDAIIGVGA